MNAAIVMDEDVSDSGKLFLGYRVLNDDGLFADIAAGHDESGVGLPALAKNPKENIVHRRAGQHDAGRRIAGRDAVGQIGIRSPPQQHDRPFGAVQGCTFGSRDEAEGVGNVGVRDHNGERLFAATLATAQLVDRGGLTSITGQLVASEAFPGHDAASLQSIRHIFDNGARGGR